MPGRGTSPGISTAEVELAVLERIRPDRSTVERVASVRARLVAAAEAKARELRIPPVRCLVAGSAARGTFLNDRLDIDLFFLFPTTVGREELERVGLELGGAILTHPETRYAEHPYLRGEFDGFTVDAVPGYAVDDPSRPMSAVDRTPFHQEYLATRQTPAMVDQVRLSKQFLRALGVYGSEARRGGFSGYLVELLVLRFGTLDALLVESRGWRIPVTLRSRPDAAARVPTDVALVLDDPVDAGRNVASALTRRNLALFILAAGAYLDHPTAAAFDLPTPVTLTRARALAKVRERTTHVASLSLARPKLVDDILYPQLRKAERAVSEEASRLGFVVVGTSAAAGENEVTVLVEVEVGERPVVKVHDGPPPGVDRVGHFLEKWGTVAVLQGPYVTGDGKLQVEVRQDERTLEELLTRSLEHLPLGRDLKPGVGRQTKFHALKETPDSPHLHEALGELLEKRLPWLGAPAR